MNSDLTSMTKAIGFSPHNKQKEIIESVLADNCKHHVVSVGRQFGKSLMGINLLLYWAINKKPCKILWVSPVYSQTNKVQKEIDNAIRHTDIIRTCNYSESYIKLRTGSEIYFRSAERYLQSSGRSSADILPFVVRKYYFSPPPKVKIGFTIYLN